MQLVAAAVAMTRLERATMQEVA
eukprot:COSAG05_NODE_22757_length_262_cov_1.042945_1_plen_22_part_10